MISAMLRAYEIPFFVRGRGFSTLYPGPQIKDYNTQTFMVPLDQRDFALELLADFIAPNLSEESAPAPKWSLLRTIRVILEALLFGWVMPGRR